MLESHFSCNSHGSCLPHSRIPLSQDIMCFPLLADLNSLWFYPFLNRVQPYLKTSVHSHHNHVIAKMTGTSNKIPEIFISCLKSNKQMPTLNILLTPQLPIILLHFLFYLIKKGHLIFPFHSMSCPNFSNELLIEKVMDPKHEKWNWDRLNYNQYFIDSLLSWNMRQPI